MFGIHIPSKSCNYQEFSNALALSTQMPKKNISEMNSRDVFWWMSQILEPPKEQSR